MRDYVWLGASPTNEDCAQVGFPGYHDRAMAELREFKRMMEEHWPPPEGLACSYVIKSQPHDFGTYYELAAAFDPENDEESTWAFDAEVETPDEWDQAARDKLLVAGYISQE